MIRYHKRFSFLRVYENWFVYRYALTDVFGLNVYWNVKKQDKKNIPAIKNISHTLELDLEQDIEAITANFSKQIRQQARIAENEGITCLFHQHIDDFVCFFNEFALKKNTHPVSRQVIEDIGDNIKLSFAVYNGQVLAAHSYLMDRETGVVRHHHSATKRLDDQFDKNLIGKANKYLTVKNIFHFKEEGFKIFDFGGYAKDTDDESLKGINNYKLLFGGKVTESFDYFSFNYWLLRKVSRMVGLTG